MAKRFTDSRKWDDPWFSNLPSISKLLWMYILDKCDHAGVWKVNEPLAKFQLGDFDFEQAKLSLGNKIVPFNDHKWFIPKFIEFQYGELSQDNRVHASILQILKKEGLCKGLVSPMEKAKDKDKDKDKDKEKNNNGCIFEDLWKRYPKKVGKKEALRHYNASVKTDTDKANIVIALNHYLRSKRVQNGYIQNASTWFNNWQDWIDFQEVDVKKGDWPHGKPSYIR